MNKDQILKYEQLYPQMKVDNFHRVENAGHWVHFENTAAFLKTVQQILQKDEWSAKFAIFISRTYGTTKDR